MTNNDLIIQFHIDTVNNEDVYPLIYKNWLAVADGLGATGSANHSVPSEMQGNLDEILKCVMCGDAYDDRFKEYLSKIFDPCIKNETNTSALWASRIVMTRFLHFLLKNEANLDFSEEQNREGLVKYVKEGLVNVKKCIDAKVINLNQAVFPTTFAAASYRKIDNINSTNSYYVDAVWAGDSRCYVLDNNGLRKLSVDDEDMYTHSITNLFSVEDNTELRFRRYTLESPFTLICASDGFFDRYNSNLQTEASLLKLIKDSKSMDNLRTSMEEYYASNRSDDTSVAFVPVGYSDYKELRNSLAARTKNTLALSSQYPTYKRAVEVINRPEKQVAVVITGRVRDSYKKIIELLVEEYFADRSDILLTDEWKNIIDVAKKSARNELEKQVQTEITELGNLVFDHIMKNPAEVCCSVFKSPLRTLPLRKKKSNKRGFRFCSRRPRQPYLWCGKNFKKIEQLQEIARRLVEAQNERNSIVKKCHLVNGSNQCFNASNESLNEPIKPCELQEKIEKLNDEQDKYNKAVDKLKKSFAVAMIKNFRAVFNQEFIKSWEMDKVIVNTDCLAKLKSTIIKKLTDKYSCDAEKINGTIEILKSNPYRTTCIDKIFADGQLKNFREYYKLKKPSPKFEKFLKKFEAFEQEADSLCNQNKGNMKSYICPDCGILVSEGSTSCIHCHCPISQIIEGKKSTIKLPYAQWAGTNDIKGSPKDEYGNPDGSSYDLLYDGSMQGYTILFLNLCTDGLCNTVSLNGAFTALKNKGFTIEYYEHNIPPNFEERLNNACQLWILSDCSQNITLKQIDAIINYYKQGKGVYLLGDNDPYYADVNPLVRKLFDTELKGNYYANNILSVKRGKNTGGIVEGHLISTGIINFYEGITISNIEVKNGLKPLVYASDGKILTAYLDSGGKRLLIDGGFTRLYHGWDRAGTDRYVVNIAGWLCNFERFGWTVP